MPFKTPTKAPKDYNPGLMSRILSAISGTISRISGSVDAIESELKLARDAILQVSERVESGNNRIEGTIVFWQDSTTEDAIVQVILTDNWDLVYDIQYRYAVDANINDADAWTSYNPSTHWVADSSLPQGGYWKINFAMPSPSYKFTSVKIQARVIDEAGDAHIGASGVLDPDRAPGFINAYLAIGEWQGGATNKFKVYFVGNMDEDTRSVGWNAQAGSDFAADDSLTDGDTPDPANTITRSGTDGRFVQDVGDFAPSVPGGAVTTVYAIARACSGFSQGGIKSTKYKRMRLDIPNDPRDPSELNNGSVLAAMLADTAVKANVFIVASLGTPADTVVTTSSGTIAYADGTTYNLSSQNHDISSSASLWYFYFDPSMSISQLQKTTTGATATSATGRRLLVGVAKKAAETGEGAFYVFTGATPTITAPYISTTKLSSIKSDLGDITAGSIVISSGTPTTTDKLWFNDSDDGGIAIGGLTKSSAPFRVSLEGNMQASSAVILAPSGGPTATLPVDGFYMGSDFFGLRESSNWKFYATSAGDFHVGSKLSYDDSAATLSVDGTITARSGSIEGTLTMGASGEVTNSAGDYTLDAGGLDLTAASGKWSAGAITWASISQIGHYVLASVVQHLEITSTKPIVIAPTTYCQILTELHLDGDLNHDGTKVGLYNTTPVVQAIAITKLTDSSGGTANDTVAAVSGSGADATINDNFADLAAKINGIIDVIGATSGVGLTAD